MSKLTFGKIFFSLLLFSSILGPALVSAQVATTTRFTFATSTRFHRNPIMVDGSSESTTTQVQRIRDFRQQSSGLNQKISALPTVANPSVAMPVLFGVALTDISPNFGDPRDNGTRTHQGEDIIAVKGTPIVSPTPAVVLRTETGVDEGNAVYTINPGGEVFVYMHLDRFGEGVVSGSVLDMGSLIGYVGNTGNAAGGPAHLHFEIHNPSGMPTDPFPRLTSEFTLDQKISYLNKILTQTSDPNALGAFLVTNFRGTFVLAAASGITLPPIITGFLVSIPEPVSSSSSGSLPTGDLTLSSTGPAVTNLQTFLILRKTGPAAIRLAQAGPTGSFGPLTQAALAEYQASVGISPASGYYGPVTRAMILGSTGSGTVPPPLPAPSGSLVRDLSLGSAGPDVLVLQKFLNAHGFPVVAVGAGSPGNETVFFGPATKAAVIRFQTTYHISPAVGYVGPLTRKMIISISPEL